MVSIGVDASRAAKPRVTLASLLADRDASIKIKSSAFALAGLRAKRALGAARAGSVRVIVATVMTLAALVFRHGLVLAGLAAFTAAAFQHSSITGLVTAGAGAFFLELRRR